MVAWADQFDNNVCMHVFIVSHSSLSSTLPSYITMMPRLRQALVEFERPDDALACVRSTAESQLYIMERPVFFNFSTSKEITR